MIRRKRKDPALDELPFSRLYLDEVREITQILSTPDSDVANPEVHTTFRVRDIECDTLEELEKIGGTTRHFDIVVVNGHRESFLHIRRPVTYLLVSAPENDFWSKRGKIRQIFDTNAVWWKNVLIGVFSRIPFWFSMLFLGIVLLLHLLIPSWRSAHQASGLGAWIMLAILVGIIGYSLLWYAASSVVVLKYSHSSGIRRWFQDHGTQVLLVVLGIVLKYVADAIWRHFHP